MITFYYPKTIRNITIALMDVFNQMVVRKYDSSGATIRDIPVPIQFGSIEKMQADKLEGPHYFDTNNQEHGQRFYLTIPRMSLILDGISYDPDRAYGVNEWRYWLGESLELSPSQTDEILADYSPTPYSLSYTLFIKTDSLDYLSQILENILPYFNPKIMLRVKEFSFLNVERDLPTVITSIAPEFVDDMANEDTKYSNCALGLTVEAFMYRPISSSKIIKYIDSKYFVTSEIITTSAIYTSAGTYVSASSGTFMDHHFSTSGVELSGTTMYPTSAIPTSGSYFTSGHFQDDTKNFNWFKQDVVT